MLNWFEILVVAGVAKVATKALSERPGERPALSRANYLGQIGVGLAAFAVLLATAGPIAHSLSDPSLETLIRFAALDIPVFALFMAASAVVLGAQRFERQAAAWIVYATSKAVFIAALVAIGFSVPGALVGNALSSVVGLAAVFVPLGGPAPDRREVARLARWMLGASAPFLSLALLDGLGQTVDLWIASAVVANASLVALYAAATVFAEIPVFLFIGLNRVLFPAVAKARGDGDDSLAARYARGGVRLAIIVTVVGVAFTAAAGRQVLALVYGSKYVAAYVPLVLLMIAGAGRTVRAACTEVLMAEGRRREALTLLAVTVAGGIALTIAMAMRWGIIGAALGAVVAAGVAAVWAAVLLRDALGARPLATLLRSCIAGVLVGAALALVMPASTTRPFVLALEVAAGIVAASALYAVVLRFLGEITDDDMVAVRQAIGR